MERFPCLICASSTRPPNSNCVTWTWSWRRVITDREVWRKRPRQASHSTGVRKTHRAYAAFSTNKKSPRESSRYEHRPCPSRRVEGPWLHRGRSSISLHRGDAFRLLCRASIPSLHRWALGRAHGELLEQTSRQETCQDRMLSKERNGLSLVLAPSLPPDRPRGHSQSPATRNRIHTPPHRDARFCPLTPAMEIPGNRAGKDRLLL